MCDVFLSQERRELSLDCLERSEFVDVRKLHRVDGAILVLGEDQDVDHADRPGVDQGEQLLGHLAREGARSGWELDEEVVNGTQGDEIGALCLRPRS